MYGDETRYLIVRQSYRDDLKLPYGNSFRSYYTVVHINGFKEKDIISLFNDRQIVAKKHPHNSSRRLYFQIPYNYLSKHKLIFEQFVKQSLYKL